ncbi:MAG: hypothetical protein ACI4OJ_07090 [Lachnospiraceae bacterium]
MVTRTEISNKKKRQEKDSRRTKYGAGSFGYREKVTQAGGKTVRKRDEIIGLSEPECEDREMYAAYRESNYSKRFLEAHREEIIFHKTAKKASDDPGLKKLLKIKELSGEYTEVPAEKKELHAKYRPTKNEMMDYHRKTEHRPVLKT